MRAITRVFGTWDDGGGVMEEVVGGAGEVNLTLFGDTAFGVCSGDSESESERISGVAGPESSVEGTRESWEICDKDGCKSILPKRIQAQAATDASEMQMRYANGESRARSSGFQWEGRNLGEVRREVAAGCRGSRAMMSRQVRARRQASWKPGLGSRTQCDQEYNGDTNAQVPAGNAGGSDSVENGVVEWAKMETGGRARAGGTWRLASTAGLHMDLTIPL